MWQCDEGAPLGAVAGRLDGHPVPVRDDGGVERVVFVVVIAVVAVGIAALVQRRQRPATPTQTGYNVPDHVDRADFARPEAEWLVVVFTSATCGTCAEVWDKVQVLASDTVAVQELEVNAERE